MQRKQHRTGICPETLLETKLMTAFDQLMKLAGKLPFDKLAQYLPLDRLPLDKLAGNALGKIDEYKNRDRMSSVDTAWLRMDTPVNLMMIVGVMMFDGAPDLARIRRTLEARLSRYNRFRQRVVQDPAGAYWVEDEHFDIGNHVHVVNLASGKNGEAASKPALEEYVAALTTQSLDFNKPLWHMTVVERYEGDGVVGHALIIRIHHCIADGIALIGVMYSLFDEDASTAEAGVEPEGLRRAREKREAKKAAAGERDFMESLFAPVSNTAAKAAAMSGQVASRYMDMMSAPDKYAEKFAGYARIAAAVTAEVAELAMMPNDSPTRFKGKPTAVKRVAWSAPLPLTDVKAVCKVLDVSVNDILLASVAGALRAYLAEQGDDTEGIEVRGFVPVNLRPRGAEHKLGNHFGLVALVLPVGIENPFARLYEVKRRMDQLKNSYQAALSMGILGAVGFLPRGVQKQVLDMVSNKGSAVMTNVPGPQMALYLAGARLAQQMFWVPQSGDIGIGVSILSYNGQVQFGLVTDRKFVPEPQAIVDRFAPEFEKLVLWLLLEGEAPGGAADSVAKRMARRRKEKVTETADAPAEEPPTPTVLENNSAKRAPTKAFRASAKSKTPAIEPPAPAAKPAAMKKKGLLARARS